MVARYRVRGRVVLRSVGGESLLVPVSGAAAGARVYPVNDSARIIWDCLSVGGSAHDAAAWLVERYRVDEGTARRDAEDCARAFVDEALLETAAP